MTIFDRLERKNKRIAQRAHVDIFRVLTISEVCAGWHRHDKTVRQAIRTGNIVARRAGKAWVVSYRSVVAWWGDPIERDVYLNDEAL